MWKPFSFLSNAPHPPPPHQIIPIHVTEHTLGNAELTGLFLLDTEVFQFFAAINNTAVNILIPPALHTCEILSLGINS